MEEIIEDVPNITINIFRNSANIIQHSSVLEKGYSKQNLKETKTIKSIKLESLIKAFNETEMNFQSPLLPRNCIKYKEKGNKLNIILLAEPKTYTMTCFGETFENCITPAMIWNFVLTKNDSSGVSTYAISNTEAYGIRDNISMISDHTQLYGLPFPNIGSNGWVCWGSNSVGGNFKSLIGLTGYIDRFFAAPFNDHLFNSYSVRQFGIEGPKQLFASLSGKDIFPTVLFENIGRDKTIGSC